MLSRHDNVPWRGFLVAYTLVLTYFYLAPSGGAQAQSVADIGMVAYHIGGFAVLSFLATKAFPDHATESLEILLVVVFLYGLVLETLQGPIPSRFTTWTDILANTAGIVAGGGVHLLELV